MCHHLEKEKKKKKQNLRSFFDPNVKTELSILKSFIDYFKCMSHWRPKKNWF